MDKKVKLINTSSDDALSELTTFYDQFKHFYYLLTLKRDTEIKLFPEAKKVSRDDLIALNEQVQIKLKNNELLTNKVTVNIILSGNKLYDYGLWEEFCRRKWINSAFTKSVSINWDFHVLLPETKSPQLHTLKLRLGSKIRPTELLEVIMVGDDDVELSESVAHGVCKVDFINAVLASELLQLVNGWYDALPNADERGKVQKFLEGNTSLVMDFVKFITPATFILILLFVFKYLYKINYLTNKSILDTTIFVYIIFFTSLTLLFSYFLGERISHYFVFNKIRKLKSYSMFDITKGDQNRNSNVKDKNSGILTGLMLKVIGAVALDIIMAIVHFFY